LYFSTMDNQIQAKMDPEEEIEGFRVVVQSLGITHNFRRFERKFCICPLKCVSFSVKLGVKYIFGIVGIPVVEVSHAAK
jgi:hypothetical protein